jgi:hypothetical protein
MSTTVRWLLLLFDGHGSACVLNCQAGKNQHTEEVLEPEPYILNQERQVGVSVACDAGKWVKPVALAHAAARKLVQCTCMHACVREEEKEKPTPKGITHLV